MPWNVEAKLVGLTQDGHHETPHESIRCTVEPQTKEDLFKGLVIDMLAGTQPGCASLPGIHVSKNDAGIR